MNLIQKKILRSASICVSLVVVTNVLGGSAISSHLRSDSVPVSQVIAQIKEDLAESNVADLEVGSASIASCGAENKPFFLIRDGKTPSVVTLKLQTVETSDGTGDFGVAKAPVLALI